MLQKINNKDFLLLSFEKIIKDNNFEIKEEGEHFILINNYCKLVFFREWGGLECNLYVSDNKTDFPLKMIPYYGFDSDYHNNFLTSNVNNDLVKFYVEIINRFLTPSLLEGKFEWIDKFLKKEDFKNNLLKKVLSLPNSNPIVIKYLNRDSSWENDIIKEFPDLI